MPLFSIFWLMASILAGFLFTDSPRDRGRAKSSSSPKTEPKNPDESMAIVLLVKLIILLSTFGASQGVGTELIPNIPACVW